MKKVLTISIYIAIFLTLSLTSANADFYRVVFTDKGGGEFASGTKKYQAARATLSSRCLQRRAKTLNASELITEKDVPLNQEYIDFLIDLGATIRHELKWMNYAVIDCDSALAAQISILPFVDTLFTTSNLATEMGIQSYEDAIPIIPSEKKVYNSLQDSIQGVPVYGYTYYQNEHLGAATMHKMGYFGDGVIIGVLDAGFVVENKRAYTNTKIIEHRDFSHYREGDENIKGYVSGKDHGSCVLSVMGGEIENELKGLATSASYYLAKTENGVIEDNIELDNMAAAIEWLEGVGVDIMTASLGYSAFDDATQSITFDHLNGTTTIAAQYVNQAFELGVLFCAAAGNNGPKASTLLTPSDADNCMSVAALMYNEDMANFSSRGPANSEIIKPTVAAFGKDVLCYIPSSDAIVYNSGTSLATPLLAASAALLLSSDMSLTNEELFQMLLESASHYESPDFDRGYGLPDLRKSITQTDISISDLMNNNDDPDTMNCFCRIRSNDPITKMLLNVSFAGSDIFDEFELTHYSENKDECNYFCQTKIPLHRFLNQEAKAYIRVELEGKNIRKPFYIDEFFTLNPLRKNIPTGFDEKYIPHGLTDIEEQNESNGFNVYPNPAVETINIIADKNIENIKIYDMSGILLLETSRTIGIDVSELPIGYYSIVINSKGRIYREKLIINK